MLGIWCVVSGTAPRWSQSSLSVVVVCWVIHGNSARVLAHSVPTRSDKAQIMEIQGRLLNQKMSPRQFRNEILPELLAEVINPPELNSSGLRQPRMEVDVAFT